MAFSGAWRSLVPLVPLAFLVLLTTGLPSNRPCENWHEFNCILTDVKEKLQSCPEDCNSTQIIEPKCKCLSLNTSGSCELPLYLISGVEALNSTLSNDLNHLKRKLINHKTNCKFPKSLNLTCQARWSPGSFIKMLADVQKESKSSIQ